jgi:N6-adenosine-specific RNA methylase IME4
MMHPFSHLKPDNGAILADPPIPFDAWSRKGEGRSPQHHYKCSAFEELAAIPIASVAALPDCFLFLWIPLRSVFLVEPLMEAWGFTFSGSGFVWVKQNRSGNGWFMGGGYSTRKNAEICWLGRRGKPRRKSAGVRELIIAPVREHSRKPDLFADRGVLRWTLSGAIRAPAMARLDLRW